MSVMTKRVERNEVASVAERMRLCSHVGWEEEARAPELCHVTPTVGCECGQPVNKWVICVECVPVHETKR